MQVLVNIQPNIPLVIEVQIGREAKNGAAWQQLGFIPEKERENGAI